MWKRRMLFWGLAIIAIVCGVALCVNLPIVVGLINILEEPITISNIEQHNVDWVLAHAYPNSTLVRADASTNWGSAGDFTTVRVQVTLESSASFDAIQSWYVQHPAGGRVVCECLERFPQSGLINLKSTTAGETLYQVTYDDYKECFGYDMCNQPLKQIR